MTIPYPTMERCILCGQAPNPIPLFLLRREGVLWSGCVACWRICDVQNNNVDSGWTTVRYQDVLKLVPYGLLGLFNFAPARLHTLPFETSLTSWLG